MEGGVEAPVVEEPGPVEDVGDVGEAQEAVKPDQLVDGVGLDSVLITARMARMSTSTIALPRTPRLGSQG